MRTYWYRRVENFGDRLAPALLDRFGIQYEWSPPARADLVTIGSILQSFRSTYRGVVLGSGLIAPDRVADLSGATVLGVRGALTRNRLLLPPSTLLGDPGILAPALLDDVGAVATRDDIAVAPHYVDDQLAAKYPDARRIDVQRPVDQVLKAIASARLVITSSLHVAIAADALGVLHVIETHPRIVGGLFKFNDYASAFGAVLEPGVPRLTNRAIMASRQSEIRDYYLSLVRRVAA